MSIIARIFIAAAVCPTLGGIAGQDLARAAGRAAHVAAGALARWEVVGLLAGASAGLLYAALTIYCVVACGERVRRRIADPIVLTLGALAVLELLVHRMPTTPALTSTVRATTIFAWLLGLLFVVLVIEYRPRPTPAEAVESGVDERPPDALLEQEQLDELRQRVLVGERSEEEQQNG
jgi:hypothetical protein